MKRATWLVVAVSLVLSSLAMAQLYSNTRIVTQVPFDFMVANKWVPAGQCEVKIATMDGKTLSIENRDSSVNLFAGSSRIENKEAAAHYALVFKRYGDRYFLSGMKLEGSKIAYSFPKSKAEAELLARNVPATEEILLASLK